MAWVMASIRFTLNRRRAQGFVDTRVADIARNLRSATSAQGDGIMVSSAPRNSRSLDRPPSAGADAMLSITTTGSVTPSASCGPPPFFDCPLTARPERGSMPRAPSAVDVYLAVHAFSANPVGTTCSANGGTFYYDDATPAEQRLLRNVHRRHRPGHVQCGPHVLDHRRHRAFAGASGFGTGSVQLNPLDFSYVETPVSRSHRPRRSRCSPWPSWPSPECTAQAKR